MKYTVYFEIFGKKMKTEVEATSEDEAKYIVMGKIIWHKVDARPLHFGGDPLEFLKQTFGMK